MKIHLHGDIFTAELSKYKEFVYNKGKIMEKIILASASPRRREILETAGFSFDVFVTDAPEDSISPENMSTGLYVQELALLKATACEKSIDKKNGLIISADTIVYSDGKILGKPRDKEDAFSMLKSLSGKCHSVFTGICVMRCRDAFAVCRSVETKVCFKELTDDEINAYIATGEPFGKAGAYGIQGKASMFAERIEGDYFNVVGLPISELYDVLKNEFDFCVLKGEEK